jgi:hypothetical protein
MCLASAESRYLTPRPSITQARPYTLLRGPLAGQTFASERQYRNALARLKGFASWKQQQRAPKAVRTLAAFERLRPTERQARERALEALGLMRREGLPIKRAARQSGTTVEAVLRHVGSTLERAARGRYAPRPYDRLYRRMPVLTPQGRVPVEVRDSRTASLLSRHWQAVRRYAEHGDTSGLRQFRGTSFFTNKRGYRLVSDLDLATIDRLAQAGELSFEDFYDFAA